MEQKKKKKKEMKKMKNTYLIYVSFTFSLPCIYEANTWWNLATQQHVLMDE